MAGIGTEEFQGAGPGGVTQADVQYRSPLAEEWQQARQSGQQAHEQNLAQQQRYSDVEAQAIKDRNAPFVEAVKETIPAYYKGKQMSEEAQSREQNLAQGGRQAKRDIAYGDTRAQQEVAQTGAGIESTKAGTAATAQNTAAAQAKLPGELAYQQGQLKSQGVETANLAEANKQAKFNTMTAEDQQKANTIAAHIANASDSATDPLTAQAKQQQAADELRSSGMYSEAQIQKGLQVAKTGALNNSVMKQTILNNEPKYVTAQQDTANAISGVTALKNLETEVAKVETDHSLLDSAQYKQGIENIANQLHDAKQYQLEAHVRNSILPAMFEQSGWSPQTKGQRARAALEDMKQTVSGQIGVMAQKAQMNPFYNKEQITQLNTMLHTDAGPNTPNNFLNRLNRGQPGGQMVPTNNPGTVPQPSFAPNAMPPPGAQQQPAPQAPSPLNLRQGNGARPQTAPVQPMGK